MNLAPEDWSVLLRLLDEALERPVAERDAWLAERADALGRLAPALRRLLDQRRAIETGSFLARLPPLPAAAASTATGLAPGRRVGPYVLVRELGRGGMADVWLAERADAAHRREVALKLPWLGLRGRVIGERFAREREIVSALTHPNIASVLDAGVDGEQPWLALEYVQGRPITEHARQQGLSAAARVRLFLQVLQAVQHAHAQLVIHRDLKPANVLVDERGQVKLLDFGVAKLLADDGATHETELTQLGGRAMTPQYASPEQLAGHTLRTASDIYALGVLLYELLSGRLPYVLARSTPAALDEALQAMRLRPPSVAARDAIAARALRGDLDTIVMKAMALEPSRRYVSAEAFAQDLRRHLESRPIEARPSDWRYRTSKLLARHRSAFAAGALAAVALVGGAGVALWQAQTAQRETRRAEAVQQFLSDTLGLNAPDEARGRELSARDLLDLSARNIDTRFAGDGRVRAQLHQTVGAIYIEMGAIDAAQPQVEQAIALHEANGDRGTRRHIEALFNRLEIFEERADHDRAREAALGARAEAERAFGADNEWTPRLLSSLAWCDLKQGRFDTARELAAQALQRQRQRSGIASRDYQRVATVAGTVFQDTGDLPRAVAVFRDIQQGGTQIDGYTEGDRLMDRYNLARARFGLYEFAAIEPELRDLVPRMDKHFGALHDRTLIGWLLLAQVAALQGHFDEAIAWQRTNLQRAVGRAVGGGEQVSLQTVGLALVLNTAARHAEAAQAARRGLERLEARYAQPSVYRERARWILADSLLGQGRREEALPLLQAVIDNAGRLGAGSALLLQVPARLSMAVAQRRLDGVPAACAELERQTGPASLGSLRCRTLEAWIAALNADAASRSRALARFTALRDRLLDGLPRQHGLRAELLAAEAEIVDPTDGARAAALRAHAAAEYGRIFGLPMPETLRVWH